MSAFFVISGPSGAGKSTLAKDLIKQNPNLRVSISTTTREPRVGESNGEEYHFLSDSEFDELLEKDSFVEWANVHGKRYGTTRASIENLLSQGLGVVLEIDTQGAFQVKEKYPEAILIFISPPSFEELKSRLLLRKTETDEQIAIRLKTAEKELTKMDKYDFVVVNDEYDFALKELLSITEEGMKNVNN